jgi:hypothetical protein
MASEPEWSLPVVHISSNPASGKLPFVGFSFIIKNQPPKRRAKHAVATIIAADSAMERTGLSGLLRTVYHSMMPVDEKHGNNQHHKNWTSNLTYCYARGRGIHPLRLNTTLCKYHPEIISCVRSVFGYCWICLTLLHNAEDDCNTGRT